MKHELTQLVEIRVYSISKVCISQKIISWQCSSREKKQYLTQKKVPLVWRNIKTTFHCTM